MLLGVRMRVCLSVCGFVLVVLVREGWLEWGTGARQRGRERVRLPYTWTCLRVHVHTHMYTDMYARRHAHPRAHRCVDTRARDDID